MNSQIDKLAVEKSIAVRLFVGQIPKIWKEEEIIEFFQKFGKVQDAQVIRQQGVHKGCAFVTFLSMTEADIAMRALNENFFLPGSTAKLQLKWADGEDRRLGLGGVTPAHANKILFQKLEKNVTEEQVRQICSRFGHVRLVKVIDNPANFNRCYVKFATKEQALSAVKALNHRHSFSPGSKPVTVVFAESVRINKNIPFGSLYKAKALEENESSGKEVKDLEVPKRVFFEFFTAEKKRYFFDVETGKTQWDIPVTENLEIRPASEFGEYMKKNKKS